MTSVSSVILTKEFVSLLYNSNIQQKLPTAGVTVTTVPPKCRLTVRSGFKTNTSSKPADEREDSPVGRRSSAASDSMSGSEGSCSTPTASSSSTIDIDTSLPVCQDASNTVGHSVDRLIENTLANFYGSELCENESSSTAHLEEQFNADASASSSNASFLELNEGETVQDANPNEDLLKFLDSS